MKTAVWSENTAVVLRAGILPAIIGGSFLAGLWFASFKSQIEIRQTESEARIITAQQEADRDIITQIEKLSRAMVANQIAIQANQKAAAIAGEDRLKGADFNSWLVRFNDANSEVVVVPPLWVPYKSGS